MIKRWIVFSYDENLFIEYAPKFKIHKCPPEVPHPKMMIAHHPYFLDIEVPEADEEIGVGSYGYDLSKKPDFDDFEKVSIPKHISQQDLDSIHFDEIVHLVNALTRHHIFVYDGRQAWTAPLGDVQLESRFSQEIYWAPDFENPTKITPQENYFGEYRFSLQSDDGTLRQRVTLQQLLDLYFAFDDDYFKQDFLNACLVVDKAKKLSHFEQSASYIFLVSAIEALVALENRGMKNKRCEICGQEQYRVMAKFRDFLDKYGCEVDKNTQNDFYTLRSQISHIGKLFQSSYRRNFFPKSQEDINKQHSESIESMKYKSFRGLVEICFATFLYWNVQTKESARG